MKVLLIKMSSMGDVLHTLPAVTDACENLPGIRFDWVVEEDFAEIPAWHSGVDQVIPVALRRWRRQPLRHLVGPEWSAFRRRLQATRYQAVIDAQGLIKSAVICRLVDAPRFGMDRQSAREQLAAWAYDRRFPIAKNMHAVERLRELFAHALHYPMPAHRGSYALKPLTQAPSASNAPGLVFCHGSARVEKLWPEDNWIQLASLAAVSGLGIYLPWGTDEEHARAQRIAAQTDNVTVLARQNLAELATLFSGSIGVVAVDTGLGHLAAALSVPTVSLYGPTNRRLIGAYGEHQVHLEAPLPGTTDSDAEALMKGITPESAWHELQAVMRAA
ncbi:MAG: lipopolysaccharide heptosyltransferase I [Pseudomonadota bacterium]